MQDTESLRYLHLGDLFVLEAIGMAAFDARQMHMLALGMMMMMRVMLHAVSRCHGRSAILAEAGIVICVTDAILLLPRAVIEWMQQVVLGKERQRTKQSAAIDRGQDALKVAKRKSVVE